MVLCSVLGWLVVGFVFFGIFTSSVFPNPYFQKKMAGNMVLVGNHHFVIRSFLEKMVPSRKLLMLLCPFFRK